MKNNFRSIGEDVFINERAIIKHPEICDIGSHNAIDNEVTISTELIMGDYIHIAPDVTIIGGAESKLILEDFSFIATGTKIVCGSEDYGGAGLVGPTIPKEYRVIHYSTVKFDQYFWTAIRNGSDCYSSAYDIYFDDFWLGVPAASTGYVIGNNVIGSTVVPPNINDK